MYCGMSLARVGLDFRGLLPPIFEAAIANVFNKARPCLRLRPYGYMLQLPHCPWRSSASLPCTQASELQAVLLLGSLRGLVSA